MTARTVGALVAVVAVLATSLAGCSSDPDEAYCETARAERARLNTLADQAADAEADVVGGTLASLRRLRDDAPPELEDEYDTVVNAWEALADAVEAAGIDPAEFDRKETLRELDRPDAQRIRQAAGALGEARVIDATQGIEDHALQVCDVDLRE